VGLTVDAPNPPCAPSAPSSRRNTSYTPDHNGIKGYTGVYMLKAAIEKVGKLDRKAVAQALHGLKVKAAQGARRADGRELRQQRRPGPRELPGRGEGRQAGSHRILPPLGLPALAKK
jgi:hypothetical protein